MVINRNIRILFLLLGGAVFLFHLFVLYAHTGLPVSQALLDSGLTTLIISLLVWNMLLALNIYPTRAGFIIYALLLSTAFSALATYLDWVALRELVGRNQPEYIEWLLDSMPFRFFTSWLIFGWIATHITFKKRLTEFENQFKKQSSAALQLKEAELYKLRQKFHPHFLYNSLNSISALTQIDPAKAQEMIGSLSSFLRSSVQREGREAIPLAEEMQYLKSYLAIESIRFGDRLKVEFEDETQGQGSLPPFLLQPVMENAIKFGVYGQSGAVTIRIRIHREEDYLCFTVTNPFDRDLPALKGTGFGLEGIRRRLYLLHGRTDLLDTAKAADLFITKIKIPQNDHVQGPSN